MTARSSTREYKREAMRRLRARNPNVGRNMAQVRKPPKPLTRAAGRALNSWLLPPGIEP